MKLQYLAVVFVIIIMPIVMVLSQYIDYQIDAINLKHTYDTKLLDATYDSIKAYQLNTVNNAISDISAMKIEDLEAAVKTFFNSLTTNFEYSGYNSSIMKDYVPAVVFSMYDGYYIYSPYRNVLTGVPRTDDDGDDYVDEDYNKEILQGIKSYVYYSCRYVDNVTNPDFGDYDVVITYTLDNYITIQGRIGDTNVNESGYLIDGITKSNEHDSIKDKDDDGNPIKVSDYTYDGVKFTETSKEVMKEYLGNRLLPYVKINGTKYYLDEINEKILYVNVTGEIAEQGSKKDYEEYKKFIENNNSAYRYYRDAYKFTQFVRENFGELTAKHAVDWDGDQLKPITEILGFENDYFGNSQIFKEDTNGDNTTNSNGNWPAIQDVDSSFNEHRAAVIRYTIQKNLETAIAGFKEYSNVPDADYIMPEISESDWETLQNNVSIITFLQGFNIAGRDYNEYCVVANNLTKEYVDENDICILGQNNMYYKPNDKSLTNVKTGLGYEPGIWKLNFERKNYRYAENEDDNYQNYYYYPIRVNDSMPYLGSYSSIVNSTSVDNTYPDLYKYMRATNEDGTPKILDDIKTAYYTALARERWGQYSVNNDVDIVQGNILKPDTGIDPFRTRLKVEITAKTEDGLTYNSGEWTNKNVILTGKAEDDNEFKEYSFEPHGEKAETPIKENNTITQNYKINVNTNESVKQKYSFYVESEYEEKRDEIDVYIDKKVPTVTVKSENTEGLKNKEIKITLKDEESGLKSNQGTYYLSTSKSDNNKKITGTYTSGETFTIGTDQQGNPLTGTYYLWVGEVFDNAGNIAEEYYVAEFKFDNQAPTVIVNPENSEVCKNKEVTITLRDNEGGSGLESNQGTYYLSTSKSINDAGILGTYTSGEAFTIGTDLLGEPLTGTYYLWVGDVLDEAGNVNKEHYVGEFKFDNQAPTIDNFELKGTSINSITVETSVTEHGEAGIASYRYYIINSQATEAVEAGVNESDLSKNEYTYTNNLEVGQTYSVYVVVTDTLGNESTSNTIEIKLVDNYMITTETSEQYVSTLVDAIAISSSGSKITVLKSLKDNSEATIQDISNLIIDLNGNTITRNQPITITSTATVEFIGKGYIETVDRTSNSAIINGGNCTLNFEKDSGIVHSSNSSVVSAIQNAGTLVMKSGKLEEKNAIGIKLNSNSNLTIEGGEILYQYIGIFSEEIVQEESEQKEVNLEEISTISIEINDGLIEDYGTSQSSRGLYFNNSKVELTINGGTIISNTNSAIFSKNSKLIADLLGGTVRGGKYGIEVDTNGVYKVPEVTIGNVNNKYSQQEVIVEGGQHAMYLNTKHIQAFNVYFYNGILKTTTVNNEVLLGAYIQEIRSGYSIIDEEDTTSHYKYLSNVENKMTEGMYAIENNIYTTLQDAATAAIDGDMIVLLKSGSDSSKVQLQGNKDVTLLLNGYTLTKTTNTINIESNARMTITGNQATLNTQTVVGFTVAGTVKMYGKVNMATSSSSHPLFDTSADNSTIDINNGTLTASGLATKIVNLDNKATCYIRGVSNITLDDNAYGIYNMSDGAIIDLEDGIINVNNNSYGIYNTSNMECTLDGIQMEINDNSYAIYNNNKSSGIINNKYENSCTKINLNKINSIGIYNQSGSSIAIKFDKYMWISDKVLDGYLVHGDITSTSIYNEGSGNIEINDGEYWGVAYGIRNTGTGNVNISGGTIGESCVYISEFKYDWAGIVNTSTGKITINGGEVFGHSVGIYNTGDTIIEIKGGEVAADNSHYGESYYAIYNNNTNANIIIGNKDLDIDISNPVVSCQNKTNYAIYTTSSKFEFYNGVIESGNEVIFDKEPTIREGYSIENGTKTDYYYASKEGEGKTEITLYTAYLVEN